LCALHSGDLPQNPLRAGLNRRRNIWIIRGERELHPYVAIVDVNRLDQPERNNVPREAGIFYRLQCILNLFFRRRHGWRTRYAASRPGKEAMRNVLVTFALPGRLEPRQKQSCVARITWPELPLVCKPEP